VRREGGEKKSELVVGYRCVKKGGDDRRRGTNSKREGGPPGEEYSDTALSAMGGLGKRGQKRKDRGNTPSSKSERTKI